MDLLMTLACSGDCFDMPEPLINLVIVIVTIIQVVVPIVLVVFGMLDLGRAVFEQKEEDIKKAQGLFVKRLIAAVMVFLVVFIVKFVVTIVAGAIEDSEMLKCMDCIFK